MTVFRLESREVLGRMGDRVGKVQKTRIKIKHMHERGDIPLDRMQRSMGALNFKVASSHSQLNTGECSGKETTGCCTGRRCE